MIEIKNKSCAQHSLSYNISESVNWEKLFTIYYLFISKSKLESEASSFFKQTSQLLKSHTQIYKTLLMGGSKKNLCFVVLTSQTGALSWARGFPWYFPWLCSEDSAMVLHVERQWLCSSQSLNRVSGSVFPLWLYIMGLITLKQHPHLSASPVITYQSHFIWFP